MQDDGFIAKILVKEGEKDISVGTPLLVMVEDEESVAAFSDYSPSKSASAAPKSASSEQKTDASESSESGTTLSMHPPICLSNTVRMTQPRAVTQCKTKTPLCQSEVRRHAKRLARSALHVGVWWVKPVSLTCIRAVQA